MTTKILSLGSGSLCELRPGIGLCDECALPKWPQRYVGYGFMVCLDCLALGNQKKISVGFGWTVKFVPKITFVAG